MLNPPHLGELIRESMDDIGWTVIETAARLNCERGTLSRVLNGKAGVSANMALALRNIGWGTADHWMRMQASYELAQHTGTRSRPNGMQAPCTHDPISRLGPSTVQGRLSLVRESRLCRRDGQTPASGPRPGA